jgi:hypothetical protein
MVTIQTRNRPDEESPHETINLDDSSTDTIINQNNTTNQDDTPRQNITTENMETNNTHMTDDDKITERINNQQDLQINETLQEITNVTITNNTIDQQNNINNNSDK